MADSTDRLIEDGEMLHDGIRYGGRVVGHFSCASEAFRQRCATFQVDIDTVPAAFVTTRVPGGFEDRFRFTVPNDRSAKQVREKIGLSAFDAGSAPTLAEVWRVGDQNEIVRTVGDRVQGVVGNVARGVADAAASAGQGLADAANSAANVAIFTPITIAIMVGVIGLVYWSATKGG